MKSLLWFGILAFWGLQARAENFYSPLLCPVAETSLHIENTKEEPLDFWFQDLGSNPFEELHIPIKASGHLTLPLADFYTQEATAIALKTQTKGLKFTAFCKNTQNQWSLDGKSSPWKSINLSPGITQLELRLLNLAQQNNPVEIVFKTFLGTRNSQSLVLAEAFATHKLSLTVPWGTTKIHIRALGRLSAKAGTDGEIPLQEETLSLPKAPQARYFVFKSSDPETTDDFIVPMTDPKLIQESLDQIQHPDRARLLVARIEKSLSGLNREMNSTTKSPWSWQVVEAQNYADFAHISCDGTPSVVEERLNSWVPETGGTICFWSYRVDREISLTELKQ
ncbi:hypothetical protein [Bdellovibrio sp. HCB337]|uniref:BP74-related protein n=1 Tax=Bdellovibrio sp. HCB337 TaxID=3394358 RepID=UPI0039A62901